MFQIMSKSLTSKIPFYRAKEQMNPFSIIHDYEITYPKLSKTRNNPICDLRHQSYNTNL